MQPREVLVTYTLYPTGNGDVRTALAGLKEQFPLRNLHWKPTSRTSLRTIQEVDIKLIDFGDLPSTSEKPYGSLLEQPMVNVCFVACDDSDIYKNNTRTYIKDWMSLVASRGGVHHPLIVLVNPPSATGTPHSSKNVFGRDRGIIAKLKADFNTSKRDICVQINLPPAGTVDPAVWPELISRLKDSIVASFDSAILEREDEVKRGETQRITPGWNFCTWFLLKESLAHSFEGVGLYEDALLIYEELEASFFQCVKERNITWFWRVGGTGPQDDSFHILDTSAKRYRDLLVGNLITVFDFRIYVFACQCLLLGKLGRITEIAKRGQWFVASLANRLRENLDDLPEYFIESWTYSACMDLVEHCDEWSRVDRPNNDYSGLIAYESARSELLDIARVQVERMGIAVGHLPDQYPFRRTSSIVTNSANKAERKSNPTPKPPLSNQTFIAALESQATYLELYSKLTNDALDAYSACGKVNSALRLKTDLAALALYTQEWESGYQLYRGLVRDCAELHVWDRVTASAIEGALRAHSELQMPRDDDWAYLALAYLRTSALSGSAENTDQLEAVISGLRELEDQREEGNNQVFAMRLRSTAATLTDDETVSQLSLNITNNLPIPVKVDDVHVVLESSTFGPITYECGPITLQPGQQTLTTSCSTSIAGLATLAEADVFIGNVAFETSFPKGQTMVSLSRSLQGLRTTLHMPENMVLDEEPSVILDICTGKHGINDAKVMVTSLQDEVVYTLDRATAEGRELQVTPASIGFGSLEKETVLSIRIPYTGVPRTELAKAHVVIEYQSAAGKLSSYAEEQSVFMGLPITVNVQDFFRPNALVSSFVIASDGHEYVRVKSVDLDSPSKKFVVEPCRSKWDSPELVPPTQPLSCLFRVKPSGSASGEVLRLSIQYRTVGEEVERAAQAALDGLPNASPILVRAIRERIASRGSWLGSFLLSANLAVVFDDAWLATVPSQAAELAKDFVSSLDISAVQWRTLGIPVEVPLRRLLTTVRLTPVSPGLSYEGRAMSFELELSTSLAWLGQQLADNLKVTYDIQVSADDWIVVGKKRGMYSVNPDKPQIENVVLVPVRHGVLGLPSVAVQLVEPATTPAPTPTAADAPPQPPSRILCETYISNAAEGVRVLPAKAGMTALVPIAAVDDE